MPGATTRRSSRRPRQGGREDEELIPEEIPQERAASRQRLREILPELRRDPRWAHHDIREGDHEGRVETHTDQTHQHEAAHASAWLRKVPSLGALVPGSPWVEIDPEGEIPGKGFAADLLSDLDTSGVRKREDLEIIL